MSKKYIQPKFKKGETVTAPKGLVGEITTITYLGSSHWYYVNGSFYAEGELVSG